MSKVQTITFPGFDSLAFLKEVRGRHANDGNWPLEGKPLRLWSVSEVLQRPSISWRVFGLLPEQGLAAIYGPSGVGKSFLALDLAAAIATGRDWFGHKVEAAPVIYLWLEGRAGLNLRLKALEERGMRLEELEDFVFFLEDFNLLDEAMVQQLILNIKERLGDSFEQAPVLFVDTLSRAMPGVDENSSKDMGSVIRSLETLRAAFEGLVMIVHHSGKDAAKNLRGHSSLYAALDTVVAVSCKNKKCSWTTAGDLGGKLKDGFGDLSGHFELMPVDLGINELNEPMSSCVIEEKAMDGVDTKENALISGLGKHERPALDSLRALVDMAAEAGGMALSDTWIGYDEWIQDTKNSIADNRASPARKSLVNQGFVEKQGNRVRLTEKGLMR